MGRSGPHVLTIRGTAEWAAWLARLAPRLRARGVSLPVEPSHADVALAAIASAAEAAGHEPPPQRAGQRGRPTQG